MNNSSSISFSNESKTAFQKHKSQSVCILYGFQILNIYYLFVKLTYTFFYV